MVMRKNYKRALNILASTGRRYAHHLPTEVLESRCLLSITISTLAAFNSTTGSNPTGAIAMDAAGNLFGTTEGTYPNQGVIWELKKSGANYAATPTVLATFPLGGAFGIQPQGGVSIDSNGNLFGTTYNGYLTSVNGTFWELPKTPSGYGTLTLRQAFNGGNGQNPSGQLFIDSKNNVFGTAVGNSARGISSTIWEYSSDGNFTVLASIDGSNPYIIQGTPVLDSAGNLYESTVDKGTDASGTILKLAFSQTGGFDTTATTLASFDGTNGVRPSGQLSIDADGNLFGTSRGDGGANLGTVWKIAAVNGIPGNIISVLGSFNSAGTAPVGGALLSNGDLFGTTSSGVGNSTAGTFWTISPANSTGTLTTLATFSAATNGSSPVSNVITDGNGNYFSTAQNGGSGSKGTIVEFKGPNGNSAGATHLSIIQQPTTSVAGHSIGPFLVVKVLDAKNQPVLTDHSTITLSVNDTNGGLTGTLQLPVTNGGVTFGDLVMTKVGSYTFTVTDGALKSDHTSLFKITPDLNTTHLVLSQQPGDTVVGKPLSIVLHVEDQYGNFVPSQPNNPNPTLTIIAGNSDGTLSGATTVAAKKGVITFSKLIFNTAGSYTLSFADPATLGDPTPVQFVQTITPGATTVTAPHPSKSYTFGQTISLSTTFKSTAPASFPFTGNATIMDQTNAVLGTVALTAKGLAKFSLANITPGTYTCTVDYAGDANHTGATSSSFTLLVKTVPTKISLKVSPASIHSTGSVTLNATALAKGIAIPLTGFIMFSDGTTTLGPIPIVAGVASFPVSMPTVGKHKYTAKYEGDINFGSSNSSTVTVTVLL